MVSLFCVRPTSRGGFLKVVQVTMKHDPIQCHVGIHVSLYMQLAFTYSVGPSSIV
jgi:hypothetical protein